jgi:hypothetical protein
VDVILDSAADAVNEAPRHCRYSPWIARRTSGVAPGGNNAGAADFANTFPAKKANATYSRSIENWTAVDWLRGHPVS